MEIQTPIRGFVVSLLVFSHDGENVEPLKLCPICLENLHSSAGCYILSCNHSYHDECIKKWALSQPSLYIYT